MTFVSTAFKLKGIRVTENPTHWATLDYGLIGAKLSHSMSPAIHAHLGDYQYDLVELTEDELPTFLTTSSFKGMNVTIPYKKAVMPYCAQLTDRARAIGSVNTLKRLPDGTLLGDNTDYAGFMAMVHESGLDVRGKKCLVLGSGGASLTVVAVLRDLGAGTVVTISRHGDETYENLDRHADAAVIVNATPVGMSPLCDASPLASLDAFPNLEGVLDLIYNPAVSDLMQLAQQRGLVAVNGLTMLVTQAAEAASVWFDRPVNRELCQSLHRDLAKKACNIILIGMPGCGKTTVGKCLAQRLQRPFVDLDAEIVKTAGMPIPDIFTKFGEAHFRDLETEVLRTFANQHGLVIATGGGAVMRAVNQALMRRNGLILWLDRPLKDLATSGRPVTQARGVEAIYAEREPIYRHLADRHIPTTTVDGALRTILGEKQ